MIDELFFSVMVGLAGRVRLNTQYHGIDYTPTEINNWIILYTIGDLFNRRYQIRDSIGDGFNGKGGQYFELLLIIVYLAGSVWVNTKYCWIDDTPTEINNWIILYTIGDVFNGRYRIGDGIGNRFNRKEGPYFKFMFFHNKIKN